MVPKSKSCYVNPCSTHVVSITTHLRRSDEQLPELDIPDVRRNFVWNTPV